MLLCLGFFLWPTCAPAAPSPQAYVDQLIGRARAEHLADRRYWHILRHDRQGWPGTASRIDDSGFFLAANGKTDPEAELTATLQALAEPFTDQKRDPRCRFVARYAWLEEQLHFDHGLLPAASCPEFDQAMAKVDPQRAVLIFPGSHLNNPASMFGHTLLSIEGPYRSRLLAYAVNYSAFTDETNGFSYAFNGIFGFYRGYYSLLPYYQKVREYSDLERRDIWEYDLDLTPAEVRRMLLHIWELRDIYSDYYFFDENCSFNLLYLLEAARPTLHLTDATRLWVIPVDTVRLATDNGLVRNTVYRPSKAMRIAHIARYMDPREEEAAATIIAQPDQAREAVAGFAEPAAIRILDLAAEGLETRYFREEYSQEEYRRLYVQLLKVRSRYGKPALGYPPLPEPTRPDAGHGSNRLALGSGWRGGDFFLQLALRPAYHQLLDPVAGYLPGSQIEFGNLELRYFPEQRKLRLHALDVISIVSLSPRNRFFHPTSWKVTTGLTRERLADNADHLLYRLNPGGGLALGSDQLLAYGLAETDLLAGGALDQGFALGFGASAGLLGHPLPAWQWSLAARQLWYLAGERRQSLQLGLDQDWRLGRNQSLLASFNRNRQSGHWFSEGRLAWNLYW